MLQVRFVWMAGEFLGDPSKSMSRGRINLALCEAGEFLRYLPELFGVVVALCLHSGLLARTVAVILAIFVR